MIRTDMDSVHQLQCCKNCSIFSFTPQGLFLLPRAQQLENSFIASWRLGANRYRLRTISVGNYRPLRAILVRFCMWPSHPVVSCWHLALMTILPGSGIPARATCARPLRAILGQFVQVSIPENQWICSQGKRVLWLPPQYRPSKRRHPLNVSTLAVSLKYEVSRSSARVTEHQLMCSTQVAIDENNQHEERRREMMYISVDETYIPCFQHVRGIHVTRPSQLPRSPFGMGTSFSSSLARQRVQPSVDIFLITVSATMPYEVISQNLTDKLILCLLNNRDIHDICWQILFLFKVT